jgi:hypothetical protein
MQEQKERVIAQGHTEHTKRSNNCKIIAKAYLKAYGTFV